MPLTEASFIKLQPGVPRNLRLRNPQTKPIEIKDAETGAMKKIIAQVWEAVGEPGLLSTKEFSVTSFKLMQRLHALWLQKTGPEIRVQILQHGTGRFSEFEVRTPGIAALS